MIVLRGTAAEHVRPPRSAANAGREPGSPPPLALAARSRRCYDVGLFVSVCIYLCDPHLTRAARF